MTVVAVRANRALGLARQLLMVVLINVPTVSLGLAMGWVSLASGEQGAVAGEGRAPADDGGLQMVVAAAATFAASLVGVPLSARALAAGRKFATIATSLAFVVCWALKLCAASGGWGAWGAWGWLLAARGVAGLGGAGAYCVSPLLARELCEPRVRGAAAAALVLALNTGILLMYGAADLQLDYHTVLWSCLSLSAVHCVVFLFVPESPAFLAANKRQQEARSSLAWLRGADGSEPALAAELAAELAALPPPDRSSPLDTVRELLSDRGRRRAFIIAAVAVVGQESCGIFTLIQFAERTFVLARDEHSEHRELGEPRASSDLFLSPARYALVLGVVQLVASALALYLVEKVGRRPLIVWTAFLTAASLAAAAASVALGASGVVTFAALSAAVAADNAGLQPAPYALLADMFHYEFRSCALMLITGVACVGNGVEVVLFPWVAAAGGLGAALAASAALTLAYGVFAALAVPETRGRRVADIYSDLLRTERASSKETIVTNI